MKYKKLTSLIKTKKEIITDINNLETFIEALPVIDMSMAVFSNHSIIYSKGIRASVDTKYHTASMSQVLTAYASLKLIDKGYLELDTPLNTYLNEQYLPDLKNGKKITLRMILNHTSGLSNDFSGKDRKSKKNPGEKFSFSCGGFRYLHEVIESITNTDFNDFINNEVISPLAMDNSSFSFDGRKANGAFSLYSTPTDMAKMFIEILKPIYLDEEIADEMVAESIKVNKDVSWGLGVGIQKSNIDESIWYWGNCLDSSYSLALFYKKSKIGVAIMLTGKDADNILREIAFMAVGGPHYTYMIDLEKN